VGIVRGSVQGIRARNRVISKAACGRLEHIQLDLDDGKRRMCRSADVATGKR